MSDQKPPEISKEFLAEMTSAIQGLHDLDQDLREANALWHFAREEDGGRGAAILAIGSIAKHLTEHQGIPPELLEPVYGVVQALHDVQRGASPCIFTPIRRPGAPPIQLDEMAFRAHAAAAMQLWMDAGEKRQEAARKVARQLRAEANSPELKPKWQAIEDWRDHFSSGSPDEPGFNTYRQLIDDSSKAGRSPGQAARKFIHWYLRIVPAYAAPDRDE